MEPKLFYRVANTDTNQGVWYDIDGNFTGLIHNKFNFCKNKDLPMPYDKDIVGYLSTTDSLETLYMWFPVEDIIELEKFGYYVTVYQSDDYRVHENHHVINKKSAIFVERIIHTPVLTT
jgi:hypothetical protein